jgi:hypothetical protein
VELEDTLQLEVMEVAQDKGLSGSDGKMRGTRVFKGYDYFDNDFFEGVGVGLQELVELEKIAHIVVDLVFESCKTAHRS